MNRRILFSDFDGTLFINSKVSDRDREAIRRWRAAGNLFAMATGRNLTALKMHMEQEGVEYDYLLCLNGAEAFDRSDKLLFESPIDIELLPGLFRTIAQNDGWANVCHGKRADRVRTRVCTDYNTDHEHFPEEHLSTFDCFTQICSAAKYKSTEGAFEIKQRVLDRYGEFVNAEVNGWSIDINAKGVSKASGIAKLIAAVGIGPEDVCAVGDNYNDLSMLTAYRGCAMERASEEVKNQAYETAPSVGELIDRLLAETGNEIRYGKLVRDRIPEIIRKDGSTPDVRVLDDEEYMEQLHRKLIEEAEEYIRDENVEEIADILEVLEAICAAKGYAREEILRVKSEKKLARGGFENRLYLISKR